MLRQLLMAAGAVWLASGAAIAATGQVIKTYDWSAYAYQVNPTQPIIYASIPALSSVAVINSNTLDVTKMIPVGSGVEGMAISPDGSRLYVACEHEGAVDVIDTGTNSVITTLAASGAHDVEVGLDNRLFVLAGGILQLDATTGAAAGPNIAAALHAISSTRGLQISPDRKTLYYGNNGYSPATLYQIDVTTTTPVQLWRSDSSQSNGRNLTLSHDGSILAYAAGSPYDIPLRRTSDMATVSALYTDAYPVDLAFSLNDAIAFTSHQTNAIDVFNVATDAKLTSFAGSGMANEMMVDSTGQHLFASYGDSEFSPAGTQVFDTGIYAPEPAPSLLAGLFLMGLYGRKRSSARQMTLACALPVM